MDAEDEIFFRERLIITKIVTNNFKSFYGEQVLGPFHKSFTSIVGPNGSGKSNVIDSVLFVFGYRSSKIRSKKITSLIYNGNDMVCDQCRVTIHFSKIRDYVDTESMDYLEEFSISRIARSDATSEYFLNERKLSFKEFHRVLLSHNIDVEYNRFLILQGEVESIALMKPKAATPYETGMLEYLEDIIGTSHYVEKIEAGRVALEEANDIRARKYDLVKISERDKEGIEPERDAAILYLEKKEQVNLLKRAQIQKKINETTNINEGILKKKEDAETHYKLKISELSELEQDQKDLDLLIEQKTEMIIVLSKDLDTKRRDLETQEKLYNKLEQEEIFLRKQRDLAEVGVKKEKDEIIGASNEFSRLEKVIEGFTASKDKLLAEKEELENTMQRLNVEIKAKTSGLLKEKNESEETLLEKEKAEKKVLDSLEKLEQENESLRADEKRFNSQLTSSRHKVKQITEGLQDKRRAIHDMQEQLDAEKRASHSAIDKIDHVRASEEKCLEQYKIRVAELESVKRERAKAHSKNHIVESLMKAQECGEISGIHGRLGDLGFIDKKYDCAVSTAFSTLDNIVVENIDVASSCVEYLRRNRLGVATFIALNKMEHFKKRIETTRKNFKTPDNVFRLFDLIHVDDPKIECAFYFAMRDTIVTDDLDHAVKCSIQDGVRWRVVTLTGEVMEKSGTMSGGGKSKASGKMLLSSEKDSTKKLRKLSFGNATISALEQEVRSLKEELSKFSQEKQKFENEEEQLLKSIPHRETCLRKLKMDIKAMESDLERTQKSADEAEKELGTLKLDMEQIAVVEKQIASLKTVLEKKRKDVDVAREKQRAVVDQINTISNKISGHVQLSLTSNKTLLGELENEFLKVHASMKTSENHLKKAKKRLAEFERNFSEYDDKLERLINSDEYKNWDNSEWEELKKSLNDELVNMNSGIMTEKEELKGLNSKMKQSTEKLHRCKLAIADARTNVDKLTSACSGTITALRRLEEELEVLGPKLTDDEMQTIDIATLNDDICAIEDYLKFNMVNLAVIEEYKDKVSIYMSRLEELEFVTKDRDAKRGNLENLIRDRLGVFVDGFSVINSKLKEFYQLITFGGDAELEFVDSLDPFIEGIVFSVRPPGKSWKHIGNISGGEKTLSSLALVFSLHYYKPSPFYFMDEIDAALDFKNVSIIANYIKERTKNSQFIIISLRTDMFELANLLVGIYKTDDCTKTLTLDPSKALY